MIVRLASSTLITSVGKLCILECNIIFYAEDITILTILHKKERIPTVRYKNKYY